MDVTSLKRTERALREQEEGLRTVLQEMPVLVNTFDEDGRIMVWNKECERVTGYS
jgi:PAS domain S-box-containing protein